MNDYSDFFSLSHWYSLYSIPNLALSLILCFGSFTELPAMNRSIRPFPFSYFAKDLKEEWAKMILLG